MPRSTTILASAVTLVLLAVASSPARAAKPVPPPPAPTIVALVGYLAIASDGTVYEMKVANATCGVSLTSATVFGRFFTTPPISPITSAWDSGIGIMASLANGDMWVLNLSCCPPCYKTGTYMGNIFTVAGTALGTVAPPPPQMNLAPVQPASGSTDAAPAAHGPQGSPVAGSVE